MIYSIYYEKNTQNRDGGIVGRIGRITEFPRI